MTRRFILQLVSPSEAIPMWYTQFRCTRCRGQLLVDCHDPIGELTYLQFAASCNDCDASYLFAGRTTREDGVLFLHGNLRRRYLDDAPVLNTTPTARIIVELT